MAKQMVSSIFRSYGISDVCEVRLCRMSFVIQSMHFWLWRRYGISDVCDVRLCRMSFVKWKCRSSIRTGLSVSWRNDFSPSPPSSTVCMICKTQILQILKHVKPFSFKREAIVHSLSGEGTFLHFRIRHAEIKNPRKYKEGSVFFMVRSCSQECIAVRWLFNQCSCGGDMDFQMSAMFAPVVRSSYNGNAGKV